MSENIAHIFPAFVLKYTGKELDILNKYKFDFSQQLKLAEQVLDIKLTDFDIKTNNHTKDEFINQVYSYIFSCAFSDILHQQKQTPTYTSGFSMGIYSALYHIKSIDFETGLRLINDVYWTVNRILSDKKYSMASVIGFNQSDLEQYISKYKTVDIVIQNGYYSFVLSGESDEINRLIDFLKTEGAIHLSLFNVSSPYHSKVLLSHQSEFEKIVQKYSYKTASSELISMINQEKVSSSDEIKTEIVKNVSQPLSFLKTIEELIKLDTNNFIEVGADTSLRKSSKFIKEDFKFRSIAKGKVL
jgi:[acyl-carrier-protein] S-malonyltransferase